LLFLLLTTDREFRVSANEIGPFLGQPVPCGSHFEKLVTLVTAWKPTGHAAALFGMLPIL
jgi:hypothetical protein